MTTAFHFLLLVLGLFSVAIITGKRLSRADAVGSLCTCGHDVLHHYDGGKCGFCNCTKGELDV